MLLWRRATDHGRLASGYASLPGIEGAAGALLAAALADLDGGCRIAMERELQQ